MKKLFLFTLLFCLPVSAAFAQKRKPAGAAAPKSAPKKQLPKPTAAADTTTAKSVASTRIPKPATAAEIPEAEWQAIVGAFDKEDWTRAALLSRGAMGRLKTDNEGKQLARLRYFYLYALAGKASAGLVTYAELEKTAAGFVGQEFLMPSREFLDDCRNRVNYICPVKSNDKALRVTATNREGSAIHAFEYVRLDEKFDFAGRQGQAAFVGGRLERAEVNSYKQNKVSVLRLFFDGGFVRPSAAAAAADAR